jgi:glycine betaine/proline transport system permease protein
MAIQSQTLIDERKLIKRILEPVILLVLLAITAIVVRALPINQPNFPEEWNLGLRSSVDAMQKWVIANRLTHPLFTLLLVPISTAIDGSLRWLETQFVTSSWLMLTALITMLGYAISGVRLAILCAISLFLCGAFGVWEQSMQTLALMGMSVLLSVLVGVPIGIVLAVNSTIRKLMRPVLDAMQTLPAFVYLMPLLLLFGVGRVPAVIATMIYAIPPVVRLTDHGIRSISSQTLEVSHSFGATRWQRLGRVQMPLALSSILTGINQTIMMALSMVVIAALIGAGGLGREVLMALDKLDVGKGLESGLAIVLLAVILDRLSKGLGQIDLTAPLLPPEHTLPTWLPDRLAVPIERGLTYTQSLADWPAELIAGLLPLPDQRDMVRRCSNLIFGGAVLLVVWLIVSFSGLSIKFPSQWRIPLYIPTENVVAWMKANLYQIGDLPIGTGPLSNALTLYLMNPARTLFRDTVAWPLMIAIFAALGYWSDGWRLAILNTVGLFVIGLLGMWSHSMDTLSQLLITLALCIAIALPLGIAAAQSRLVGRILSPILDFLQTIPTFVYLVPVIMLFNIGRVPGMIAAMLYAIPPGIKLIELGIRQVSPETLEAARSYGATRWQLIYKVQLPLALPSIMLGVNQMLMMVLAMVIIAGLVGSGALGLEAVTGLRRVETGRGIEAGIAIVILAMILDRLTQAWAKKLER